MAHYKISSLHNIGLVKSIHILVLKKRMDSWLLRSDKSLPNPKVGGILWLLLTDVSGKVIEDTDAQFIEEDKYQVVHCAQGFLCIAESTLHSDCSLCVSRSKIQ